MFELAALLIAFIGIIFLSLFTLLKNPKSATNRLFFIFSLTLSFYLLINHQINLQVTDEGTLFWVRLVMTTALFIVLFFYLLTTTFPKSKLQTRSWTFWYALIFTTSLVPFSLQNYIWVTTRAFGKGGVPGPAMPFFLLHSLTLLGGGILTLVKKYKKTSGIEKIQLKFFLLSSILMFVSILTTNLLIILVFKTAVFINLLPLYILIFVGFISYAIVRHRFLDINLLVARSVSYALLIGIFGVFYAVSFTGLSSLFISSSVDMRTTPISVILALIMVFSFQPLRRYIEKITDTIFYKNHYDTNKLLYDLALIMASTLRLEDVTHGILREVLAHMKIVKGAFILLEKGKVFNVNNEGFKSTPVINEEEIELISRTRKMLVFDELEEGDLKTILRNQDLSVVVHLQTEGEQVGFLVFGEKQSGDIYSDQDLSLLEILAPEAAVAIQNSKAYEEIRRFNITLQDEVDRATADLQVANEHLKELDKLKDEFVSLASHELRTPMAAIKGSLSTIMEGYVGQISPQAKDFLTAAYNENDRLIRLVNNLLNISRIEAGRYSFNITKLDLDKIIKDVVNNLQMAANEKHLYLKYEDGDGIQTFIWAEEDKVKEVLINFIGNAIKFTHEGGITVKSVTRDNMAEISVTDTGHGIAKEDHDLLFKKFSQVGKSYTKQAGGTGLGLYICKKWVEGMKGRIWLESELGKGSTFFFTLPLANNSV